LSAAGPASRFSCDRHQVVTRSSLLGRRTLNIAAPRVSIESVDVAHSVFLCEEHRALTGNPTFQNNLLNTLLSVDPD
jgi:hypothetical protein